MLKNYDGLLKVDGEIGNKKVYDPRAWGKTAEAGMAARVVQGCEDLRCGRHQDPLAHAPSTYESDGPADLTVRRGRRRCAARRPRASLGAEVGAWAGS